MAPVWEAGGVNQAGVRFTLPRRMDTYTLKRGCGRSFEGENWKLAGDKKWVRQELFLPSANLELMGTRPILGVEHCVFRCHDDSFFAQPKSVCELPDPENPLTILSIDELSVKEDLEEATVSYAQMMKDRVIVEVLDASC